MFYTEVYLWQSRTSTTDETTDCCNIIYAAGLTLFAIQPALYGDVLDDWLSIFMVGFLFGFFCYITYEMTNMATLRDWKWSMVVYDVSFGAFLFGAVCLSIVTVFSAF